MTDISLILEKVRIRINDYVLPYEFSDEFLLGLINLAMGDARLCRVLGNLTLNVDQTAIERDLNMKEINLLAVATHLQFLYAIKTSTDRSTLSMAKGRLRIDNTEQSRNLQETIDRIESEFKQLLANFIELEGVRVE